MQTAREDESTPQEDATPPEAWPGEPEEPHGGIAPAAPDDVEDHSLEEPGYGHGSDATRLRRSR